MKQLYTAHATAIGGRNGHAQTDDNQLSVELASPGAPSKKTGNVTNPEQLFACGYAACFGSAVEHVAKQQNITPKEVKVAADVSLNQDDSGFFISAVLNVTVAGVDNDTAQKLVQAAHQVCPYSKATRGNIEVTLKVNDQELAGRHNVQSINPATGEIIKNYSPHDQAHIMLSLEKAQSCFGQWKETGFAKRAELMQSAARLLRERKTTFARLMADEMGKPWRDGEAEIQKCALVCEYYAENAEHMLADEPVKTSAHESFITYQPQGIILAIMPWNFPFWQVFRFAAPNLMAGNVGLLKHASNVCGCAIAIEELFEDAGFPEGCFASLLIPSKDINALIEHRYIRAVTLTGSAAAGRSVAAKAGECLKKTVLELGGSDPYVILEDADIALAAAQCAESRLLNAGQSCICAKRFIVVSSVKEAFEEKMMDHFTKAVVGHPGDSITTIGPMARADLRDALHKQVEDSIAKGAILRLGGKVPSGAGAFYPPTLLSNVKPGMPAFDEELFGPVAAIIEAKNEEEAFALANQSSFGLGSAIFSNNVKRATALARTHLDAGQTFVNTYVKSDPHLPFGGVKESGYGRELGTLGIKEFMNAKTVVVG